MEQFKDEAREIVLKLNTAERAHEQVGHKVCQMKCLIYYSRNNYVSEKKKETTQCWNSLFSPFINSFSFPVF